MYKKWVNQFLKIKKENCEYCRKGNPLEINGRDFDLKPTAGFNNDRKYSSWIMKGKEDKKAGIMITTNNSNGVYFDINYCPMCRKEVR